MDRISVITPTYRVDREVAEQLCASIDKHCRMPFHHYLVIPRCDVKLFQPLVGADRSLVVMEDVLGSHGFTKLPIPARITIPFFGQKRFREKWHVKGAGVVSGWLIQQIMKLSAPDFTEDEHLLMIDSDIMLVRDLDWEHVKSGDLVRLHCHMGGGDIPSHKLWRDNALKLLGRPAETGSATNFVGNIIAWRRSHVLRVQEQIEATTGRDWRLAIAQTGAVSEYILYGYSCKHLADEATGHVRESLDLAHSLWFDDSKAQAAFAAGFTDKHVAVHIQSTLPLTFAERSRMIEQIVG